MLKGLYQPSFEKDSCGFGLIAQMDEKPSHWLVSTAILLDIKEYAYV